MRKTAVFLMVFLIAASGAYALPDMKASVKVSGGGTYDYFILGLRSDAGDGFDNAYDSFAPGASMNDTFITAYFSHPEWNTVKSEFRADIKSVGEDKEWVVAVSTNLPSGTPLTLSLDGSSVPPVYTITLEDTATGQTADISAGPYEFSVLPNQMVRYFKIASRGVERTAFDVAGVVRTEDGSAIAGATVTIRHGRLNLTATSGPDGQYLFSDVPPGTYKLRAHKKGYRFSPMTVIVASSDVSADIEAHTGKKR